MLSLFFELRDSNLKVKDFGPSWRDGIAFLTIIDTIQTNLVDINTLKNETNRTRLETAFNVAEQDLGITRLLDPEVCLKFNIYRWYVLN